jgi:hypothetical protein
MLESTHESQMPLMGHGIEPSVADLQKALQSYVDRSGSVSASDAHRIARENGWSGRLVEVLELLAESDQQLGYVAGGRRPDEVATWVGLWAESALNLSKIALVVRSGGWDPDPFVVLDREGLLEALLVAADGSPRRVDGELAGAWMSDELALAEDAEIVARAQAAIAGESSKSSAK